MRSTTVLALFVVCALLSGCSSSSTDNGDGDDTSPEHIAALEDQLRAKPPFETAQAEYRKAMTQTADRVAALVPGLTWEFTDDSWLHCGGRYLHTRATQVRQLIKLSGPIPDDQWPRALQIVKSTARSFGATDVITRVDRPGNRDVVIRNADGVEFHFGTAAAGVLSATSDCRLRQGDR